MKLLLERPYLQTQPGGWDTSTGVWRGRSSAVRAAPATTLAHAQNSGYSGDPVHPWEALVRLSDDALGREAPISSHLSRGDVVSEVPLPPEKPPWGPTVGKAVNMSAGPLPRALQNLGNCPLPQPVPCLLPASCAALSQGPTEPSGAARDS